MNKQPIPAPARTGLFFDTETTGIPDWKIPSNDPAQPHMTQLAAILANLDTREPISSMNVVIYPDSWAIPQEVVDVNGVNSTYARKVGVNEEVALRLFLEMWQRADTRMAYNTTFDNRIICIAIKRYLDEATAALWKSADYECQMVAAKKHLGVKSIRLEAALQAICGRDLPDAHDAMADTQACMDIYFALQAEGSSGDIPIV